MYHKEFTKMDAIHGECENGRYAIRHTVYKPSFRDAFNPEYHGQSEGDVITVLHDIKKREIVMSDSVMEQRTNIDFVRRANGHVLIGGLGLGMVVLAIQDKPEVESITVVELEQELYDLSYPNLEPHLNDKVKIIISDIHDFEPERKYDVVYCDIWNDISGDNWDEMKSLTKKFKYKVNRDNEKAFLDHWRKGDTKRMANEW